MASKMTLEQFFSRPGKAATVLREALETNMEVCLEGARMDDEEKEIFMRANLISIRNCLQDYGDED